MMDCYWSDTIPNKNSNSGQCSSGNGVQWCCNVGDYCLSNGLCQYGDNASGVGASGFYLSGCTDQSFKSDKCRSNCTGFSTDVVYDWGVRAWRCCGADSNGRACLSGPQGTTMSAPSPPEYTTYATIIASGKFLPMTGGAVLATGVVTTTVNGVPTVSAQPAASSSPDMSTNNSGGLGPGAAAGIAIGALLGLLLIIGLLGFVCWRQRRHRSHQPRLQHQTTSQPQSPYRPQQEMANAGEGMGVVDHHATEKAQRRHELETTRGSEPIYRSELPIREGDPSPAAHEVGIHA